MRITSAEALKIVQSYIYPPAHCYSLRVYGQMRCNSRSLQRLAGKSCNKSLAGPLDSPKTNLPMTRLPVLLVQIQLYYLMKTALNQQITRVHLMVGPYSTILEWFKTPRTRWSSYSMWRPLYCIDPALLYREQHSKTIRFWPLLTDIYL